MTTTSIIPSYPYVQFADDVNISAWFDAYNTYSQKYLDWFNDTPLAVYTNDNITGTLLDWVANGVYGIYRVPISTSQTRIFGPLNTYTPNYRELNSGGALNNSSAQTMTDDIFKRLITWNFYKGDGMQFTIPWIKKRVARFIYGINGFSDTYNISVIFTDVREVKISISAESSTKILFQQLYNLLQAGIPNFPYGYDVTMTWIDENIKNDDFGGDIA